MYVRPELAGNPNTTREIILHESLPRAGNLESSSLWAKWSVTLNFRINPAREKDKSVANALGPLLATMPMISGCYQTSISPFSDRAWISAATQLSDNRSLRASWETKHLCSWFWVSRSATSSLMWIVHNFILDTAKRRFNRWNFSCYSFYCRTLFWAS